MCWFTLVTQAQEKDRIDARYQNVFLNPAYLYIFLEYKFCNVNQKTQARENATTKARIFLKLKRRRL